MAKKVSNKSGACQAVKPGEKSLAPPFTASSAGKPVARAILKIRLDMRSLGIEWTEENLEKYLQALKNHVV
ncbi:MAG: hypothetical protein VX639_11875 [Pseudomonadota bacterium]|nr:hypothetical protein [Pseudomonadota bacterium]